MSAPAKNRHPAAVSCARCGSTTAHPFAVGAGGCLRCAGERALTLGTATPFDSLSPDEPNDAEAQADTTALDIPTRVGPYEIIEELGRGGMGRVYAARQSGLGRIVALKVLSPGPGASLELEMRFLREAQIVARLRHPHIIAIHDSGRDAGHVYFSMDYLEAGDLAHRLRDRPFTPRESAALVAKVAAALAYAHCESVLHRDIKPSNILLDGDEPRLADFGLAAQLETSGDLTSASGVFGTPHYLAPEALRGGAAALTAASDLYALGVLLFAMLTGRTPFAGASLAELPALIQDTEPPSPRLLAPIVPRDLETICLKCLERDPARRYADAAALTADLGRFLAGAPITAQPPSIFYSVQKLASRHRAAFISTAIVATVLVAASLLSTGLAIRARRAEKTAGAISDFLQHDLLAQAAPTEQPDRDLKLRTLLDRATQKITGRFTAQPLVEASIRQTLGKIYSDLGEYTVAQQHFQRAFDLRCEQLGKDDPLTLSTMADVADALQNASKLAEAEALGAEVLTRFTRVLGAEHLDTIRAMDSLAYTYRYEGKFSEAETLQKRAIALRRRVQGSENPEFFEPASNLVAIYLRRGQLAEAEALIVPILATQTRLLGPDHPSTLTSMNNLAVVYRDEGKLAEAEQLQRQALAGRTRVLGAEHPNTLMSMSNLASVYLTEGKFDEAEALLVKTLEIKRRVLGPEHQDTLVSLGNLGSVYRKHGKLDEARAVLTETLALRRHALGATHPSTLMVLDNLGRVLLQQGKFTEAEPFLRESWEGWSKSAPDNWMASSARSQLGVALFGQRRFAEAEPLLLQGYADLKNRETEIPAIYRSIVPEAAKHVIELYTAWGRPADADAWKEKNAALEH